MSGVARVVFLVAIWLLAWGGNLIANLLTGVVVAIVLLAAFPPEVFGSRLRVRPIALLHLAAYVLWELVTSNLLVAREILTRRSRVRTGVIVHELDNPSDWTLTIMANIIALTPGTMTVDATREPAAVHVHFLLLDDIDDARSRIAALERRTLAAFGHHMSGDTNPHSPEGAT